MGPGLGDERKESGAYAVRDDVRVPVQTSLGIPIVLIVTSQIPDDERLITTAGEEHVRAAVDTSINFFLYLIT